MRNAHFASALSKRNGTVLRDARRMRLKHSQSEQRQRISLRIRSLAPDSLSRYELEPKFPTGDNANVEY